MGHAASPQAVEFWGYRLLWAAFRQGLADPGFEDGRNVAIEFRWAEGQGSRLPATPLRQIPQERAVVLTPRCGRRPRAP